MPDKQVHISTEPPQVAPLGNTLPSGIAPPTRPWTIWHDSYAQPPTNPRRSQGGEPTEMEHVTMILQNQNDMIQAQNDIMKKGFSRTIDEELPKFNGDYRHWGNWYEQFLSLVDKNPRLPIIVKYRRLLNALQGEALESVAHFHFEEGTYKLVKEELKRLYGKDEIVVFEAIKAVQNHGQVSKANIQKFPLHRFVQTDGLNIKETQPTDL